MNEWISDFVYVRVAWPSPLTTDENEATSQSFSLVERRRRGEARIQTVEDLRQRCGKDRTFKSKLKQHKFLLTAFIFEAHQISVWQCVRSLFLHRERCQRLVPHFLDSTFTVFWFVSDAFRSEKITWRTWSAWSQQVLWEPDPENVRSFWIWR